MAALCIVPPERMIAQVTASFAGLQKRQVADEVANRASGILRDALLLKPISGELRVRDTEWLVGAAA